MNRSRVPATVSAALLLLGVLAAPGALGAATTPVSLAVGPTSASYQSPHGFTTSAGTALVSWYVDAGGPSKRFQLARQHGTAKFTRVTVAETVAGKPMTVDAAPQFYQSGSIIRMVTQARVPALGQEHQGAYVWTSTDDGRSWSGPRFVYKYFASNEIAPDSNGGFWAVSELTSVYVIHVPRALTFQTAHTALSDRVSSRGWMELATAGANRTLLTAFYAGNGSYLHVGSAFGTAHDVKVFGPSVSRADLAGDAKRAILVGVHPHGYKSSAVSGVYARSIAVTAAGKVTLGKEVLLSGATESVHHSDVSVRPIRGHAGQFGVTWLDDKNQLRYRHTTATGWAAASTRLAYADHGYPYLFQATPAAGWIVAAGLRTKAKAMVPVVIAVRAA